MIDKKQPTNPHLVWGRRLDQTNRKFRARAAIVEHLISHWTKSDWSGVDVSGGGGRWLSTLAPRFSQFTHLDFSPDALRVAQKENPEFSNVEYGPVDLLQPRKLDVGESVRMWDAVFCLDTLLYSSDFVETALKNIRAFISPRGVAIIDVPMRVRASISQKLKGRRYGGPQRVFSQREVQTLIRDAGYTCLETAYQFNELSVPMHRFLATRGKTGWIQWPGTWMYLVLRVAASHSDPTALDKNPVGVRDRQLTEI
jgi:SAM-dependent methyltransferase